MGTPLTRSQALDWARQALGLGDSASLHMARLGKRGSDRVYFRLTWPPQESAILIHYDPNREENGYHAQIAQFLHRIGVPVPRMIGHDPVGCLIVMEDLGETDLWTMRDSDPEERQRLYGQTISAVQRLHSFPESDFPAGHVRLMGPFSLELYRWERDYFRDYFVGAVCGITLGPQEAHSLEIELSGLADRLLGGPCCLVHRDLQSQNVMIRKGEPVFIDFQGMRFGSPFYDLGSLLCDPYMEFSEKERNDYLSLYYGLSSWGYQWEAFTGCFWEASAQRLMQALGAYGFLSLSRGLLGFLNHIPAGLRNLEHAAARATTLPRLRELLHLCRGAWARRKDQ